MIGLPELLLVLLGYAAFGLKVWALADASTRPAQAYVATGKLSKPVWIGILAAAVLLDVLTGFSVLGLFGLLGIVAAIVYLVDVRPAVRELRPGGPWG